MLDSPDRCWKEDGKEEDDLDGEDDEDSGDEGNKDRNNGSAVLLLVAKVGAAGRRCEVGCCWCSFCCCMGEFVHGIELQCINEASWLAGLTNAAVAVVAHNNQHTITAKEQVCHKDDGAIILVSMRLVENR